MKRRLWCLCIGTLTFLALVSFQMAGTPYQAHAATTLFHLSYYGADLNKMAQATGVDFGQPNTVAAKGPWPQYTNNYCFTAAVQGMVNYADLMKGLSIRYPVQSSEGPASGNPANEQSGQILYDMDHHMLPPGGPLKAVGSGASRRPYTLANIAYDFGGDPRSQSFATAYEAPAGEYYHEHIFHNGAAAATMGIAKALAAYSQPVIALVNHAEHSVLVAGVWATGNPLTDASAQISSLVIYNPWNQSWGAYLSSSYYTLVSYNDWLNADTLPSPYGGVNTWFQEPYQSNGTLDPDPSIGIYQAGTGTSNPSAHHWIGNYVIIQRDSNATSANYTYDENDHIMLKP